MSVSSEAGQRKMARESQELKKAQTETDAGPKKRRETEGTGKRG